MAVKVFFIAKIKDFNDEYKDYVSRVRDLGESHPGFISLENEEIGDLEITVTTWRSKEDVADWAKDPVHVSAKKKAMQWYHWVRGYHVETPDSGPTKKKEFMKSEPKDGIQESRN